VILIEYHRFQTRQNVVDVVDSLRIQTRRAGSEGVVFLRIRLIEPLRKIEGGVLLVDIDELKRRPRRDYELNSSTVLTLHGDFDEQANELLSKIETLARSHEGTCLIRNRQWRVANSALKALLEGLLPEKKRVENFEIHHNSEIGPRDHPERGAPASASKALN